MGDVAVWIVFGAGVFVGALLVLALAFAFAAGRDR